MGEKGERKRVRPKRGGNEKKAQVKEKLEIEKGCGGIGGLSGRKEGGIWMAKGD